LGQLNQLDQLDQLDQFDQLDQLDQLNQLNQLDQLDHLDQLDQLVLKVLFLQYPIDLPGCWFHQFGLVDSFYAIRAAENIHIYWMVYPLQHTVRRT